MCFFVDFLRWIFYSAAKQAKLSSTMSKDSFRKDLSMPGLLREMRECFDRVPDLIISRGITLSDCLMTGLAIFCLKIPSMLKYEQQLVRLDESTVQAKNLKSLFGVMRPLSDTWLRERLDGVDPGFALIDLVADLAQQLLHQTRPTVIVGIDDKGKVAKEMRPAYLMLTLVV